MTVDHDWFVKAAGLTSFDEESREVTFVASTDTVDADGDIVEQTFNLDRYLKNPVILYGHNRRDLPIGTAKSVGLNENSNLEIRVRFASKEANPLAEQVFQLVKEGVLRSMSIGFRPGDIRLEMRDGNEVFVLSNNELFEASVVPIPSNPDALAKMKQKAAASAERKVETNTMELEQKVADLTAEVESLKSDKGQLERENTLLETRCSDLEDSNKELSEKLKARREVEVEKELTALVGKKISASEVECLKELASANEELYEKQLEAIKGRPDSPISKQKVMGDDPTPRNVAVEDNGESFEKAVSRL